MNVIVVGGEISIYFLCRIFLSKGYSVTVIDDDKSECVRIAKKLNATVVFGDGSDPLILEEAGANATDMLLATTFSDPFNLIACQTARLQFNVPRVMAVVNDPDNESVFKKLGVMAFSTTRIIASMLEQHTSFDEITNLIPAGGGKVNITELKLTSNSPVTGKSLRELSLPENSLIAVVLRGDKAIVPCGETELNSNDHVVLITLPDNHGPTIKAITGEKK